MSERDELAKDIFAVDNWRLGEIEALAEWEVIKATRASTYAFSLADGLLAKGYSKEAGK
jgi:hypothetical protein